MVNLKNIILLALCLLFVSCSPREIREAKHTVTLADSLWHAGQMYGVDAGDSATLAQAYETLGHFPLSWGEGWGEVFSFSHACYHYGRLLRQKENPVEAMQVFINATHSHTRDYHILGRIYSNMGDIAHLASEFELSYDMYKQSGEMYLKNKDSLLYYYDLNNMAFELAELGKKEQTLALLSTIEAHCKNKNVLAKTWETKAKLYLHLSQYDSTLQATYLLHNWGDVQPSGYVLKARALWHLGQIDSALYYARHVINMPEASDQNKYNMLYILLNGDSTLLPDEIKSLSEKRADLEAFILVPKHKKSAIAANLLHQDLEKIPRSIIICIWSIVILCIIAISCLYARKIQKAKRQQQEAYKSVRFHQQSIYENKLKDIEQACSAIRINKKWKDEIYWKDYDSLCGFIDTHFFFFAHKLKEKHILNEKEIRLCILVLLGGFSDKQMADILCYSEKSIRSIKRITAQKLGTSSAKFRSFLIEMLIGSNNQ